MNVRCYRCGWSFSLSREMMGAAVAQAQTTKAKHHVAHCPKCRQAIKVSVDQLKRFAPSPPVESATDESAAKD